MKIVAFGHEKDTGKDSAGRFLCGHLRTTRSGIKVEKHGFADKLKDICNQLYGWAGLKDKDYYETHREQRQVILPKLGKTPRQIWIEFGTLVGREIYYDTWIDYLLYGRNCDFMIITDMRFVNEAQKVLDCGGYLIKIERPSIPHTHDIADDPLLNYDRWTKTIVNDGTIKQFHDKVIDLVESLQL